MTQFKCIFDKPFTNVRFQFPSKDRLLTNDEKNHFVLIMYYIILPSNQCGKIMFRLKTSSLTINIRAKKNVSYKLFLRQKYVTPINLLSPYLGCTYRNDRHLSDYFESTYRNIIASGRELNTADATFFWKTCRRSVWWHFNLSVFS